MAKYYISSGDLRDVISVSSSPQMACKISLERFMLENKKSQDKSICQSIAVSEKGFRDPSKKLKDKSDDVIIFDTTLILDMIT